MKIRHILLASASLSISGPARAGALKAIVDSLDDLPEVLHSEYIQQGDKFVLQVEGAKPQADFDRLQAAHTKEKSEHSALKSRITATLGDRKFEDVVTQLDRIPELEAAAEGKLDDEKINSIVEGRVKTRLAPVERERDQAKAKIVELEGSVQTFTVKERKRMIDDEVRKAAKAAKVTDEALDDALLLGANVFEVREDDGKVVVKEGVGFTQGIEPSVLFTDLQGKKPHWFGQSSGGGAGGQRGGSGARTANPYTYDGWNMTEQGKLYQADPAKADQLAKLAGHKQALGATRPAKK